MTLSMYDWTMDRQRRILRGVQDVPMLVSDVREATKARVDYLFSRHQAGIQSRVQAQHRLEPNDPHASKRALAHYKNGICAVDDYAGEMKTRECNTCEGTGREGAPSHNITDYSPCADCEGKGQHTHTTNVRHP